MKETLVPPGTQDSIESSSKLRDQASTAGSKISSIEGLLSHNRDLAARLNVAISKNIELENTINKFKKSYSHYENRIQKTKEQLSLNKEKYKYLENENKALKEKLYKAQAYLTETTKSFEKEKKELKAEVERLRPRAVELQKIQDRVENEYLPERDFLRQAVAEKSERIDDLISDKASLEKGIGLLKEQLDQAAGVHQREKEELKAEEKQKQASIKEQLDKLQSENIVLTDRNRQLRKEQIERTELVNRIEQIKREKELNIHQSKEEKDDLLIQVERLKRDLEKAKIEAFNLKKHWSKSQDQFKKTQEQTGVQAEQVVNLQALWKEKCEETEGLKAHSDRVKEESSVLKDQMKSLYGHTKDSQQRLSFFFDQLSMIQNKQTDQQKTQTRAMEQAFRKAVEPILEFDYNIKFEE